MRFDSPHVCAIGPRIVAVATPIYRGNKHSRRFLPANDPRDDRLSDSDPPYPSPPPACRHVLPHIFYDSARKGFGARARPTANWLADPSDRRIIKDVLARIYLSYLVVEIDRYNSVWIRVGSERVSPVSCPIYSTRYTMIR